jgi:hypothetical protein
MTYTGAGPFRFDTFTRIHSRAKRRHLAQGSFTASGWSGATSGEGSQRRLSSAMTLRHFSRGTHLPFLHASQPTISSITTSVNTRTSKTSR